jgi:hypothetical protein
VACTNAQQFPINRISLPSTSFSLRSNMPPSTVHQTHLSGPPLVADNAIKDQTVMVGNENIPAASAKPIKLRSPFWQSKWTWLLAVATAIWLGFTLVYAFATSSVSHPLAFATDATSATRNLRILSEGVTLSLTALIGSSAGIVMWAAASSQRGITLSTWLAMSTSTGTLGLLSLLGWKGNGKNVRDLHRPWIIVR